MNRNNILVSVVIPSFNRYKFLVNAVKSVLEQDISEIEIIIVNDGSTDFDYFNNDLRQSDLIQWIDLDQNRKLNYKSGPANIASVRNVGIEKAKGEYIAFLDDDDIWMANKLKSQLLKMEKTNTFFSSTDGYFGYGEFSPSNSYEKYNQEKYFKEIKKKYKKTDYKFLKTFPQFFSKDFLKVHNCVVTSSVIISKDLLIKVGGFNEVNWAEDYECWLRILDFTNLLYISDPLFYYDGSHGNGRLY